MKSVDNSNKLEHTFNPPNKDAIKHHNYANKEI